MTTDNVHAYELDPHIAEIYDVVEADEDDVGLIRRLIGARGELRVFEPFAGTGRILIPLAADGHCVVGMDRARGMLDRARVKVAVLPGEVGCRISLIQADAVTSSWPRGFDLIILGANCLYELATPEEQEGCIADAATALNPGGLLYLDNNHMEGELDVTWRTQGIHASPSPNGTCADGTRLAAAIETVWYDAPRRLVRFRRTITIWSPDGGVQTITYIEQKHPPSTGEMRSWLTAHGFIIEREYGDRKGNPYTDASGRAIFWARLPVQ